MPNFPFIFFHTASLYRVSPFLRAAASEEFWDAAVCPALHQQLGIVRRVHMNDGRARDGSPSLPRAVLLLCVKNVLGCGPVQASHSPYHIVHPAAAAHTSGAGIWSVGLCACFQLIWKIKRARRASSKFDTPETAPVRMKFFQLFF